tara:strand:- start:250 stop:450 length:201 start_codon:yes stop_codon:yes gene_type:complete
MIALNAIRAADIMSLSLQERIGTPVSCTLPQVGQTPKCCTSGLQHKNMLQRTKTLLALVNPYVIEG